MTERLEQTSSPWVKLRLRLLKLALAAVALGASAPKGVSLVDGITRNPDTKAKTEHCSTYRLDLGDSLEDLRRKAAIEKGVGVEEVTLQRVDGGSFSNPTDGRPPRPGVDDVEVCL